MIIRTLRLIRVFRVLKLGRFLSEIDTMRTALWQSRAKILVFLYTVLILVAIMGTAMYVIEHRPDAAGGRPDPRDQFTSIPQSMYWAIVTMTTVGYGDVVPQTALGKAMSSVLILFGYSLIIVPTGFVSAELVHSKRRDQLTTQVCPHCMKEGHDTDARHCKYCGVEL
jgi:voltage-gated potassium channel